jgi:hypothetical protein
MGDPGQDWCVRNGGGLSILIHYILYLLKAFQIL